MYRPQDDHLYGRELCVLVAVWTSSTWFPLHRMTFCIARFSAELPYAYNSGLRALFRWLNQTHTITAGRFTNPVHSEIAFRVSRGTCSKIVEWSIHIYMLQLEELVSVSILVTYPRKCEQADDKGKFLRCSELLPHRIRLLIFNRTVHLWEVHVQR